MYDMYLVIIYTYDIRYACMLSIHMYIQVVPFLRAPIERKGRDTLHIRIKVTDKFESTLYENLE